MSENKKQEMILHFKKFYNALPLISKQRLKTITDKELNTVSEPKCNQSFLYRYCEEGDAR